MEDMILLRGVTVWRQQVNEARLHSLHISLARFLFLRQFGFRIPTTLGWLWAMIKPLASVDALELENAHR
jgi:hypothetical protein